MDVKEIRRLNLEGLIAEAKTIAALERDYGLVANLLSQVRTGHRGMGDKLAREIEAKMGKQRGWMDSLQFGGPEQSVERTEALQILMTLSDEDREAWLKHGRLLVSSKPETGPGNPFGPLPKGGKKP